MIIFLFFSLFWAALLLGITEKGLNSQYVWLVLGSILIYWGGAYTNAPDTKGYMFFFDLVSVNGWVLDSLYGSSAGAMEPGTFIIMQLCKQISGSYYLFQFVILSIDIILTYWGIKKISNNNAYIVVFFLLFTFMTPFFLAAMRQGVAIAIMIFCLPFFRENKYYIYVPLLILAIFFHQSAILLICIPVLTLLLRKFNPQSPFFNALYIIIFFVCNFCYMFGISASNIIESSFGGLVYDNSLSTSRELAIGDALEESSYGVLKLIEIDVCYILLFFTKLVKRDQATNMMSVFFLIFFILNTLVGGIVIHRLTYYLQIPYYFVLFISLRALMMKVWKLNFVTSNIFIYTYMFIIFMIQSASSTTYIFEYHLFDILK